MKIAVYGIAKNEQKHVEGFMKSIDNKANGVFITDTGSEDGTFGALIYHDAHVQQRHISPFRFDVARNVALSYVPEDYDVCISLDIDERLRPGWRETVERVMSHESKPTRCWVRYKGPGLTPFYHSDRIHSRRGYMWDGPAHETIIPYGINEVQVANEDLWIDHEPDFSKPRNYLPLLAAGVNEQPHNRRRVFYYARELMCRFQFKAAISWLEQYMKMFKASGDEMWEEPQQALAMIEVCKGAMKEMAAGLAPAQMETLKKLDRDALGILDIKFD